MDIGSYSKKVLYQGLTLMFLFQNFFTNQYYNNISPFKNFLVFFLINIYFSFSTLQNEFRNNVLLWFYIFHIFIFIFKHFF